MKKIVKVLGIIIVLLFVAILILPSFFKDDIVALVKEESNNAVNAKISFGDFGLSLIKSFPDFYLSVEDIAVEGIDQFEGIELAAIKEIDVVVDLWSVISGDSIKVKRIGIVEPSIHVQVLADGNANYLIAKESEEEEEPTEESTETTAFNLALQELEIVDGSIIYSDASLPVHLSIDDLDIDLIGDFTESVTNLDIDGGVGSVNLTFDEVQYLTNTTILLDVLLNMDLDAMKFSFKENEVTVNALPIGFDGWLALPNDPIDMDLRFQAKGADIKSIFSMIPAEFAKDLEGIESDGNLSLDGFVKGTLIDSTYPSFGVDLNLQNGRFHYTDLPQSITDIQINGSIQNPDGELDHTVVDVSAFHLKMGENPFDANFYLATPLSDPYIKAGINGKIILDNIRDLIHLPENDELSGTFIGNLNIEGNLSTLDEEAYDQFKAEGSLKAEQIHYKTDSLDYSVDLEEAVLVFSPEFVALNTMKLKLGESDLQANGRLENFLGYTFKKGQTLKGNLEIQSTYLNLNELVGVEEESVADTTVVEDTSLMEVILLPQYINFTSKASIGKILYDQLLIENVTGGIVLNDRKMELTNTTMNLLNGQMQMNGFYETTDSLAPSFDFGMDIAGFDLKETVKHFNTVDQLAPLAKYGNGEYSTKMSVQGKLDQHMEPEFESINGQGNLQTNNISFEGYKPLAKVSELLKYDRLNPLNINDANIDFQIIEGKVFIAPFTTQIGKTDLTISGSNSFDQTIDYVFSFAIPREEFGSEANDAVDGLLNKAADAGVDLSSAVDIINVDVTLKGPATNPKIGTNFKKSAADAKDALKEKAKEELEAAKQKAKEELEAKKKEAEEKAKQELEKQKKKAQKELEKQKQKAKEELEKQKEELKDKAKGALKDLLKKK